MPKVNEKFAMRLKDLRLEKGLSQEVLGKIVETTKASISRYELSITTRIPDPIVEKLAQTFNVNKDWLLGETDKRRAYRNDYSGPVNDDESALLDKYRSLNKNGKNLAQSQMSGLAETPSLSKKSRVGAEFAPDTVMAASGSEGMDEEQLAALNRDIMKYAGGGGEGND